MTRLTEAVGLALVALAIWVPLLTLPQVNRYISKGNVQLLPIYTILVFGVISALIVLYRVFTFNNCPDANEELQKQINEARADLSKKGFSFKDNSFNQAS